MSHYVVMLEDSLFRRDARLWLIHKKHSEFVNLVYLYTYLLSNNLYCTTDLSSDINLEEYVDASSKYYKSQVFMFTTYYTVFDLLIW